MERPTQEIPESQIAWMEGLCLDVEENARQWRMEITDENTISALCAIEIAAHKLGDLVGQLASEA